MKSLWNITLIVGSLQLPVKVYGATKKSNPEFEMVDSRDLSKIKFIKCNASTGEMVPNEFIGKIYAQDKIRVPVTEELLKSYLPENGHSIRFSHFVNAWEVPLCYHDNFFFLYPDLEIAGADQHYSWLRDLLMNYQIMGLSNAVWRNLNILVGLSSNGQFLLFHKLRYHEQIEKPDLPEIKKPVNLTADFEDQFDRFISGHTINFYQHPFRDEYSEALTGRLKQLAEAGSSEKEKNAAQG